VLQLVEYPFKSLVAWYSKKIPKIRFVDFEISQMVKAQFVQRDAAEERTKLCIFSAWSVLWHFQRLPFHSTPECQ
jgi:hypothetical protein